MYRKRDGSSVFHKSTYYRENPVRLIKYFLQDIKFCYQRIRYGWCDRDTWDINTWFLKVMPPMLQHLRDNLHGYPYNMEEGEWYNTLETMIKLFSEADENYCSMKNSYDIYTSDAKEKNGKSHAEREKEIFKYRDECKNKAFEMFSKYFWNLWD